jgi:hypothetical protein
MMHSKLAPLAFSLLAACTTSSEVSLDALAAGISTVDFGDPILPPSQSPIPKAPLINLCESKPDLGIAAQTASQFNYPGYTYVCTPIKNAGGKAWSSGAGQQTLTISNSLGGSASKPGPTSLAPGASTTTCMWVKAPGLLRMGHDEPKWGECKLTMNVTTKLLFDPDILSDGNTSNDDCNPNNNTRKVTWNYMGSCPW